MVRFVFFIIFFIIRIFIYKIGRYEKELLKTEKVYIWILTCVGWWEGWASGERIVVPVEEKRGMWVVFFVFEKIKSNS